MLKMNRKRIRTLFTFSLFDRRGRRVRQTAAQRLRCRCLREGWGFPVRPATRRRPDSTKRAISSARPAIGCPRRSERAAKRNHSISSIITACDSRRATTRPAPGPGRTPHTTIISICSRLSYMPLRALGGSTSRQT